jgi:DNA topoisomerase-1
LFQLPGFNYPDCNYTRKLGTHTDEGEQSPDDVAVAKFETIEMGKDPKSGEMITLRKGPYGFYFQWGEQEAKSKIKPKRASLPKTVKVEDATLELALEAGALPRTLGTHPVTGEELIAAIGRFGPYIKHGAKFVSLKKDDNVYTITLERAIELVDNAANNSKKK